MAQDLSGLTPGIWTIDPGHTSVEFIARHIMVTKVRGRFTDVAGQITIAPTPTDSTVTATIQMASVDTGDTKRDDHLRSEDFFNVAINPTMTFTSTGVIAKGSSYMITGDLALNGTTKGVEMALEFNGIATDPWGAVRAAFSATTEINRKDFGLVWNVALEAGGMLVSENVKIELEIQATKA
jgi:polyisoprenoid-binding protein YceI